METKRCTLCPNPRDTNKSWCKECFKEYRRAYNLKHKQRNNDYSREYYKSNIDKIKDYNKKHYVNIKEKRQKYLKDYYSRNKDKVKLSVAENRMRNRGKYNSIKAKYKAKKKMAMPKWLTPQQLLDIEKIYVEARRLGLEVDHIVPITSDQVCGLHVPWNLQLLSKTDNVVKGNKLLVNAHSTPQCTYGAIQPSLDFPTIGF